MDRRAAPAPLDLANDPDRTDTALPAPAARGCARRQALLAGAVGVGVVPLLAACGNADSSEDSSSSGGGSGSSEGSSDGGSAAGIPTSDIPVGGGTIFGDQELVVTQPTEGDFKAFSALCTHQGCLVTGVTESGIDCSCHGSVFSLDDGSVLEGPADEALPSKQVTVDGDTLTVA